MEERSRRIAGLDLMKVLGLYLVVLYHMTFRQAPEVLPHGLRTMALYFPVPLLSICVPLFFLSSGALSLTRPLDLRKTVFRALHLTVLLLIWTGVSLFAVLAIRGERVSFGEFVAIASEMRIGYIQHLWYLPTFIFLTLFLPVLHSLKHQARKLYRYLFVLLAIFTFGNSLLNDIEYFVRWRLGLYMGDERQFFWFINFFRYHFWYSMCYLILGGALLEHRDQLPDRRWAFLTVPVCILMLFLFGVARSRCTGEFFDPAFYNYDDPFTLILALTAAVLLINLQPGPTGSRIAASISNCSLGIYLVHWLIIEVLMTHLPRLTGSIIGAPLAALPVLLLSWGVTWLCLKIPVLRNLFTANPSWLRTLKKTS